MNSLTILIPVYNEADNISPLVAQLNPVLRKLGMPYEILFVEDGSTDNTYSAICRLRENDVHIRLVRHRRNFGKAAALSNGFAESRGSLIITMDGDLQDDPAEIPRFVARIGEGNDLVSGWKVRRKDPLAKTLPSKLFNALTRWVSGVKLHDFNCGFKAYRAAVVKNLPLFGEMHRYIPVIAARQGFKIAELPVHHRQRLHGKSKYGFSRLFKGAFDLMTIAFFTRYSERPLHLFGSAGAVLFGIGFLFGLYLTYLWFFEIIIWNRPLLILSVLFMLVGIQLFSTGIVCEMLVRLERQKHDAGIKEKW